VQRPGDVVEATDPNLLAVVEGVTRIERLHAAAASATMTPSQGPFWRDVDPKPLKRVLDRRHEHVAHELHHRDVDAARGLTNDLARAGIAGRIVRETDMDEIIRSHASGS
jgi:hypothetical protein